jgi:hypothetical protein
MPSLIPIDPVELETLTDKYSDREIAKILNTSHGTICRSRKRFGISTHRQKTGLTNHRVKQDGEPLGRWDYQPSSRFKMDYFKEINSPEKAYWLGYLYADGWVSYRSGKPKEIGLACHPEDAYHLHKFREAIAYWGTIVTRTNKSSLGKNPTRLSTFRVTQQLFALYTVKAGVVQRKSNCLALTPACLTFPSHFVRGYFDGDGSLSNETFVFICNTAPWLSELMELIRVETGCVLKSLTFTSPTTGKQVVRLVGQRAHKEVIQWMYRDSTIHLDRKYEGFSRYWE